ncbi:MAG TPA: hypothetical protein VN238_06590 [Solirubrobacteraceae bacterium]|nr:hypothetical protein [Solirubrobacteraceae bacterium]
MSHAPALHHFASTAGDPTVEIAFHEEVLGLVTVRSDVIVAHGREATRLTFAAAADARGGKLEVTCLGAEGRKGRLGSNGPKSANLAVPEGSLDFWQERLHDAHVPTERVQRLGTDRLELETPSGVAYAFVAAPELDNPGASGTVGPEHAVRGLYSVTLTLMDVRETDAFLVELLDARHVEQDIAWGSYELGAGGPGNRIELLHEPYRAPGTWAYAVGTPHHIALDVGDPEARAQLCERLRDAGYPDISPTSVDGALDAAWVRTPGGTLVGLVHVADRAQTTHVPAVQAVE